MGSSERLELRLILQSVLSFCWHYSNAESTISFTSTSSSQQLSKRPEIGSRMYWFVVLLFPELFWIAANCNLERLLQTRTTKLHTSKLPTDVDELELQQIHPSLTRYMVRVHQAKDWKGAYTEQKQRMVAVAADICMKAALQTSSFITADLWILTQLGCNGLQSLGFIRRHDTFWVQDKTTEAQSQ